MISASPDAPVPSNLPNQKRAALLVLLGVGFVEGIADTLAQAFASLEFYQVFSLLMALLNLILLIRWFVLDAREHEFRLTKNWILALVVLMVGAAPVYFVKTRGARFWKPLLLGVLFLLALALCAGLGSVLTQLCGVEVPDIG